MWKAKEYKQKAFLFLYMAISLFFHVIGLSTHEFVQNI